MKTAYDRDRATRLVPLLRSITREIRDRTRRADRLRRELDALREDDRTYLALQAELATQLREARLATTELERLGCSLDPGHPLRVLIPGREGASFAWRPGSGEIEPEVADSAA